MPVKNSFTPNLIAGADVGFEEKGTITRAAMVVMRWPSLAIVEGKERFH